MKLTVLLLATSALALSGCGMSYEECRTSALKEWQKCAGEAIRNENPRPGALGACIRTHDRKEEACKRWPKEGKQAGRRPGLLSPARNG